VAPTVAALTERARWAGAAAIDIGLPLVRYPVGTRRRAADFRDADEAAAIAGGRAALPEAARRATAAAIDVGLVLPLHSVHAVVRRHAVAVMAEVAPAIAVAGAHLPEAALWTCRSTAVDVRLVEVLQPVVAAGRVVANTGGRARSGRAIRVHHARLSKGA